MATMAQIRSTLNCRRLVVDAVRSAVGTRFRPQGRLSGVGLDCVGVALIAARSAGLQCHAVPPYVLGGNHGEILEYALLEIGYHRTVRPEVADIIVFALGNCHRHLAVITDRGIVHAHAGLGRVVEGPIPDWPVVDYWTFIIPE